MIHVGTLSEAGPTHETFPLLNGVAHRHTLIRGAETGRPSPHVFLIEQTPGSEVRAHFHHNAEFQVMVAGAGRLGRHPVAPLLVHYAGQQTGYGPIVAGDRGLSYVTLRPVTEFGAWFLPEAAKMVDRTIPKGQTTGQHQEPAGAALPGQDHVSVDAILPPIVSGLAAWRVRVPPRAMTAPPSHPGGAGRFYLVTAGTLQYGDRTLEGLASVWIGKDDVDPPLHAGRDGLEVLVLQFPADAWAYESRLGQARDGDPRKLPPV